jgi:glycosyltransferase involved in cell wall biosynthesis
MRIAVIHHTIALENDYGFYVSDLLSEFAAWIGYDVELVDDFIFKNKKSLPDNAVIGIDVKSTGAFGLRWWYSAKLPAILKNAGAEAVINLNCMLGTAVKLPQILAVPDISFLEDASKATAPWQKLALKNIIAYTNAASAVITYSAHAAGVIEKITGRQKSAIEIVPYTAGKQYKVWEWHEKVTVRTDFTDNKEFFVAILDDNKTNLWLTVLKAFSKFKKWQQSNMQLLLIPKNEHAHTKVLDKITTYKYKDDVQVLDGLTLKEKASVVGCAYAMVHLPSNDGDLQPIAEALQCATPVITVGSDSMNEYFAGNGILVASLDQEAIGDALIAVYKNEEERTKMIENAKARALDYERNKIARPLWALIERVVGK